MTPQIRKIVTYDEEVLVEGFKPADPPWRMFAVAAVVQNPWAGRFVEDLKPEIMAFGPVLGAMLTERISIPSTRTSSVPPTEALVNAARAAATSGANLNSTSD